MKVVTGHILRKVYNCRERNKNSDLQNFELSSQNFFKFPKNFRRPFLVISSVSYIFQPKDSEYNYTTNFSQSFSSHFSTFFLHFSTLFHCSCSKFTTTTAQFPFYNCKFHFSTAQIVISCTLKYALPTPRSGPAWHHLLVTSYFDTHPITLLLEILGTGAWAVPSPRIWGAVPQSH